jgi:hypothetical protein
MAPKLIWPELDIICKRAVIKWTRGGGARKAARWRLSVLQAV